MITNATQQQIQTAIDRINETHGYTVSLKDFKPVSKNRNRFTIKAESGQPGSRDSWTGRRGPWASWHAHGYLFDELFNIDPNIFIRTGGRKITKDNGNWIDINVGSMMRPGYMSELSNE